MPITMVGNHGRNAEGITTLFISATHKDDLYYCMEVAKKAGFKFWDTPNIQKAYKNWTVILKIYLPKELGYPIESS